MVANPQAGYEFVRIEGKRALVCATPSCRLPLQVGVAVEPVFVVPEVGDPHPYRKQAVCGPCYRAQYEMIYPGKVLPDVPDAIILGHPAIPKDWVDETGEPVDDDFLLWEKAVEQARGSGGAETVNQAYKRLMSEPDIEISAPPDIHEVVPIRE